MWYTRPVLWMPLAVLAMLRQIGCDTTNKGLSGLLLEADQAIRTGACNHKLVLDLLSAELGS